MQNKMKKSCLSLILATSMIMANFSTSIIAHKPLEKIIQVKGMSYDNVISDALRAKLNETGDYIDCMVYFKDDTSNEDIQKLSKTIKTEESKDDSMTKLSFRDSIFENDTVTNSKYCG